MNKNKKRLSRITVKTLIIHLFSIAIILAITALYVDYAIKNSKSLGCATRNSMEESLVDTIKLARTICTETSYYKAEACTAP